jgi:hypothetical protein
VREEAAGRHQFAKSNASAASAALKSLSGMALAPAGGDALPTASSVSNDVQLAARGDAAAALRMDALTVAVSAQSVQQVDRDALAELRGGKLYERQIAINESLAHTVASTSQQFADTLDTAYKARMRWRANTVRAPHRPALWSLGQRGSGADSRVVPPSARGQGTPCSSLVTRYRFLSKLDVS